MEISKAFDEQKIFMPYSKDIQGAEENDLLKVTDDHKRRNQEFYGSPLFAQAQAAQPTVPGAPGAEMQPQPGTPEGELQPQALEILDQEEPEPDEEL